MENLCEKRNNEGKRKNKGFTLPSTTSKPSMPPVKPPKEEKK